MKTFSDNLKKLSIPLERKGVDILQVNVGKLCNQSCIHCHVDAGPDRREIMTLDTVNRVIAFVKKSRIKTIDITGGAPELNPHFMFLISSLRHLNSHIIVRSNLTILLENDKNHLSQFYKDNEVELICSLPCYLEENVDKMRGRGVYKKSIEALKTLNNVGYGKKGSNLKLHLVYNPDGAGLPPMQKKLEQQYKQELLKRFGIVFNNLYVFANIPINRYERYLKKIGKYEYYLGLLKENFNTDVIEHLMCRTQISVGWDGRLYDCDFNQMLDLYLKNGKPYVIGEVDLQELIVADIQMGDHCYGCTAGSGSSCGGTLVQ
ncbi:MAG: arsenosugar biosynthesis radical SAM protein ArsS [Nitrospinota bacterium]|nr:arsenosugar biosynthesis radical SAM protein ArsS [Nitrospinota bacterium]